MMTKTHFKKLAEAISTITSDEERGRVAELIGKVCHRDNPNFDWGKWLTACRVIS